MQYRIAGKFGRNYIWRNGLQAAKNKYWQNLNLAIGNCAYKFLLRHRAFVRKSAHGLTEVSRSHGRVSTRGHHIYKSTSTLLLGEVLECKIESGNVQDRYAVAVQRRKMVVGHGKISAACSLFLPRAGRIRCTVIGIRCFPIYACPLLRRVVIVFASQTSFLRLCGLMFDATLDFSICAFLRSFWIRADDSIACYLPRSVGPSCEKYLHVQSHSVFTCSDFTTRWFNG